MGFSDTYFRFRIITRADKHLADRAFKVTDLRLEDTLTVTVITKDMARVLLNSLPMLTAFHTA